MPDTEIDADPTDAMLEHQRQAQARADDDENEREAEYNGSVATEAFDLDEALDAL